MPACVESIVPSGVEQPPSKVLGPVDVGQLPGMDAALERALRQRGVVRVEQLRRLPKPVLVAAFGDAVGRQLWASARGLDGPRATTAWSQIRTGLGRFRGWLTSPCEN
jgi:nucleotidyltransferase/DNA polymerase involved in DNA repair